MYVQDVAELRGQRMRAGDYTLIIGNELLALGLAAQLRGRGEYVLVRGALRHDLDGVLNGAVPSAVIIDLLVAHRDDFLLLRRLQASARFCGVPVLVLSPGTIGPERTTLEARLRSLGARPLLAPHGIDDILNELARSRVSVA